MSYSEEQRAADLATVAERRQAAREAANKRREVEIARCRSFKSAGYSNAEVADAMALSESTVRRLLDTDETYDSTGQPLVRGRCDTCGKPCDEDGCTNDRSHDVVIG